MKFSQLQVQGNIQKIITDIKTQFLSVTKVFLFRMILLNSHFDLKVELTIQIFYQ